MRDGMNIQKRIESKKSLVFLFNTHIVQYFKDLKMKELHFL